MKPDRTFSELAESESEVAARASTAASDCEIAAGAGEGSLRWQVAMAVQVHQFDAAGLLRRAYHLEVAVLHTFRAVPLEFHLRQAFVAQNW